VEERVVHAAPIARLRIEQGVEVGRPGVVHALVDAAGSRIERVRVGGQAVHLGDGEIRF